MKICVSVDMDNYEEYRSLVDPEGDHPGPSFYLDAVPRFLDLFERHRIRATFFMIGRDCRSLAHQKLVREIVSRGHEVGNHTYTHPYCFRKLSRAEKESEIDQCDAAIADILGQRPVGFRTPSCEVDSETLTLLAERGYLYDSSVIPSPLMWAFMLYGKLFVRRADYQLGHPGAVLAPTRPYVPSKRRVYRPDASRSEAGPHLVEIPFSVVPFVRVPFYSTLLRIFGPRVFALCVRVHGSQRPMLHTLFHIIELADFADTSLGRAFERMPGLGVSFARRRRFIHRALETLAGQGDAVPLREIASAYLAEEGSQ